MSGGVDVLRVLDAAIARADEDAHQYRYEVNKDGAALREARAAVAELIAERDELVSAVRLSCALDRVTDGLREALAKVPA